MITHHRLARLCCAVAALLLAAGCRTRSQAPEEGPPATAPALVQPTEFGAPASGVRLGIAAERARFTVGEPIQLSAAARNVSGGPMTLRLPAFDPEVTFRQDLITLHYPLDELHWAALAPDEAWSSVLPGPLSLAPGRYRLRVDISAPEPSAAQANNAAPLWHGEARSNVLSIDVVAPAP